MNAHLIAAGISPFIPELAAFHAGRLMIEEIKRHASSGESFAFETTLSGGTYAQMIPEWQRMGGCLGSLRQFRRKAKTS